MNGEAIFFFFSSRRRHTRWNCDWSSDVCSSDLVGEAAAGGGSAGCGAGARRASCRGCRAPSTLVGGCAGPLLRSSGTTTRSEERRVGKECRSRWWADEENKKVRGVGREEVDSMV